MGNEELASRVPMFVGDEHASVATAVLEPGSVEARPAPGIGPVASERTGHRHTWAAVAAQTFAIYAGLVSQEAQA